MTSHAIAGPVTTNGLRSPAAIQGAVAILGMFVIEPPANEQLSAAPLGQRPARGSHTRNQPIKRGDFAFEVA